MADSADEAFIRRIQEGPDYRYVPFESDELRLCQGPDWALATVESGRILALDHLRDVIMSETGCDHIGDADEDAAFRAAAELVEAGCDWLGDCTNEQFAEPARLDLDEPENRACLLAAVREVIAEV